MSHGNNARTKELVRESSMGLTIEVKLQFYVIWTGCSLRVYGLLYG